MRTRCMNGVIRGVIRAARLLVLMAVVGVLIGCSGPTGSHREDGMFAGGVVGAGTGAIVGNQLGVPATGAIIGGMGGASIGAIVGAAQDRSEVRRAQQRRVLERQEIEKKRQQDELNSLRRQEYYDRKYQETMRRIEVDE